MTLTDSTPTTQTTAATAAPVRTLGIVSLVLGIASIVTGTGPIMGVAAIVVAILALRQEPASKNFAIAGLVTGAVSVATVTIGIGAFLAALPFLGVMSAWGW
ncbi:MAG: hypothetical protein KF761_10840 [Salinibacterium sp.]|nr:hypothetical protein [Salinibacterium sp.]